MLPRVAVRSFVVGVLAVGLGVALCRPAPAQPSPEARADYLDAAGLDDEAEAVEDYLLDGLEERGMGTARQRERTAGFFSFVLTVSGVTLDAIRRLEENGVDVVHAVTARSRPLMEQALLADLVVVGTVAAVDTNDARGDGHSYGLTVAVSETLKGTAPADTILIRQKRRTSAQSPDPTPEVGETFLFLASNGMYRFYAHSRGDGLSESALARRYSIYRRYRLRDDQLLWKQYSRAQTEQALDRIRTLDGWLTSE